MTGKETERSVMVLLSTYNGEKYLPEQLESLQRQNNVHVTLAVRDDASTDRTCEVIERFRDSLETTLIHGENVGAARSFLMLVHAVKVDTEYYAYCDQDDYWLPEKLSRAVERLETCDKMCPALYYSNVRRVGEHLEEIEDPFKRNYHTEEFGAVLISTAAPGCTMVFNRALLLLLKEYMPKYLTMHDSWTLQVCAAVGGTVIYDDDSYILYRQHVGNVIGGVEKMRYGKTKLFLYRVRKLFDWECKPSKVAEELIKGYNLKLTEKNLLRAKWIKDINKFRKSSINLFVSGVILKRGYTPYTVINFKYFVQVLSKNG